MDRLVAMARGEELPEHANGAALFADISGFSTLATRLERTAGPALAVERLSTVVDGVFGLLVRELHRAGGAAICFAGDAVTGWFDDRPEAAGLARAEACARAIQDGVAAEAEHGIALRIGVAAGPARRLLLGDPAVQLLDAVAGRTVARAVAAQDRAEPGETVIDEARAGAADGAAPRRRRRAAGRIRRPSRSRPASSPRWQHAPVLEHLQSGAPLLADLRRVAVLFARCPPLDFDADPGAGDTLDAITRHAQHALTGVGGTLLHVVVGDKGSYVVGAVGAPLAQPDHSRRAARAARALHAAVPGELAIGVAEGRAWAGLVGTAEQSCYTLLGGVINRAARLMGHAPPGETYVSPRLARALTGAFTLRDAGRVTLKGDLEPVALTAVGDELSGPVAASPMVGRGAELDGLLAALAESRRRGRRWASVRAAPGLGKSRLLDALAERAGDGVVVLRVAGSAADRVTPYAGWRAAVAGLAGGRLDALLAGLPERAREHAPLLAPVLPGAPPETRLTRSLSTDARQESTQRLLAEVLDAARGDAALLVCADDTQWLDSASAALLRRVGRDLDRVLVVAAARPEASRDVEPPADVLVDLAPLAGEEIARADRPGARRCAPLGGGGGVHRGAVRRASAVRRAARVRPARRWPARSGRRSRRDRGARIGRGADREPPRRAARPRPDRGQGGERRRRPGRPDAARRARRVPGSATRTPPSSGSPPPS